MTALDRNETAFVAHLRQCYARMPIFPDLLSGQVHADELKKLAKRHYAEIRAFIDIKLPARLYLCPHEAMEAKQYFHSLYREEQGSFGAQPNHAVLFKPTCYELGLTDAELDAEYAAYARRIGGMFARAPSVEALVDELAVSFAWESFVTFLGPRLVSLLQERYKLSEVTYFREHMSADEDHSRAALLVLAKYANTPTLETRAMRAISDTLVDNLYLTWQI